MITLSIQSKPAAVFVNDFRVTSAPTARDLLAVLGEPSNVYDGAVPAPAGHRNNQIYIYNELGLTFNEHHHARLVQGISCWFETDDPEYRFTPSSDFAGHLLFDGEPMPLGGDIRDFMTASPLVFGGGFAGGWQHNFEGFGIFVRSRGHKLPSGRRSKVHRVVSVAVSWPHDPWAAAPSTPSDHGDR